MPPFRIGLAGAWHPHTDGLVRQIIEHPGEFLLAGIFDSDRALAGEKISRWRVPGLVACDSLDALLAMPLDGVAVEGRVYENISLAFRAIEAGFPVLLEKPAGTDLVQFERLIALAQSKNLHLQMAYLFRYMSAILELVRFTRAGQLGRIYRMRGRLPKELETYGRLERDLARYRGGIFFEMAGHMVDLMVTLLGEPERVSSNLCHHHSQPGAFIDNAVVTFEFPAALATLETTALEVAPDARRFEVYGTEGAFVICHLGSGHLANQPTQTIETFRAGDSGWSRRDLPAAVLQISDLREFAACVQGEKQPDYSLDHDLIVQRWLIRGSE